MYKIAPFFFRDKAVHCFVSSQYLVICFLLRIKDNEIHNVQYHPMLCISYRKLQVY